MAVVDMVKLADSQWEAGADAIDWDTTGASGDPEFLAALRATAIIREKYPDIGVQLGMAGEFVLGMHGELEYEGVRLAGLWPREQLLLAQKAGATMFGPVVNVNTGKSLRLEHRPRHRPHQAVHGRSPQIPVHPNAGMGVGAVPMFVHPPADAVCRAAKAFVDILQGGRLVGRLGRPARYAQRPRAGGEHRRYSGRRRPGCPYADDPRYATRGSQSSTWPTSSA